MKKTVTLFIITAVFLLIAPGLSAAAMQADPEQLKGMQIRNEQGEKLGTIENVVIGLEGEIEAVIVEKGGFLGIGGEENRIPWTDLKQEGDSSYLVYIRGGQQDSGALVEKTEGGMEETRASTEQKQSEETRASAEQKQSEETRASAEQKQSTESQKQARLEQQGTLQESGQVLVKQRGARVEVEQSEPQVQVKQPEPKVDVQQSPPKVTVTQPAPQIEVKVIQPKPKVTVQQQQPQVDVQQDKPKVMVQQDKPEVKVMQQKPQVTVTKSKPEVQVDTSAQAKVSIEKQQQAQIEIQKTGKPQVELITEQQKTEQGKIERQQVASGQQQIKTAADIEVAKADDLLEKEIIGINDEKLGIVKMNYLSEDKNTIVYLIILGDDDKMHPVPAELVRIDQASNELMADFDKKALQNSPSFKEQEQPELDQQKWSQEIRAYYGEQKGEQSDME